MTAKTGKSETEVVVKAKRRTFTAEYKNRILKEVDVCRADPGGIGAVLRREGLYSSHLTLWRSERDARSLEALTPKKRGPKPAPVDVRHEAIAGLEKELAHWKARAERAEILCDVQKKLSNLLGISLPPSGVER